jgi:chemotaxis protein MotB
VKRQKKHEEEEHENHERWLVSYADMVTLLMCLFIVLFAMSQVDQKKFEQLGSGLADAFGNTSIVYPSGSAASSDKGMVPAPVDLGREAAGAANSTVKGTEFDKVTQEAVNRARAKENAAAATSQYASLKEIERRVDAALVKAGYPRTARYKIDERGLTVSIVTDKVLFDNARADLRPAGARILDTVAPTLRDLPNAVTVEGHTNHLQLRNSPVFASNWELSAIRATTVLRRLVAVGHVSESRLSASGYAEKRPLVSPDQPSAITLNRRVDLIVLSTAPAEANALLPTLSRADTSPVPSAAQIPTSDTQEH